MDEKPQENSKRLHFGLLLLISFTLFSLGFVVDQVFRWSDHIQGLINGIVHILVFGLMWCFSLLPWSLVIFMLYRWGKWTRFRTQWVLAPAVLGFVVTLGGLLFQPPTPSVRFKDFAGTDLPQNARELRWRFTGGGVTDYGDTYYFETTPDEVDRMIAEMRLSEDELFGRADLKLTSVQPLPGCPEYSTWVGAKQYKRWDDQNHWFFYLITDSSRTKVYVMVGCT